MKILISTDTYYPQVNGASYFTQRLAYYLQNAGHEIRVVAPSESIKNTDTTINDVRLFGIRSYPVFFYKNFRFCIPFFIDNSLGSIVHDFNPDIIHVQGHFAISRRVIAIAKEKNIPLIATNHFMPENLLPYLPFSTLIGPAIKKLAWKDFSNIFKKTDVMTTPTAIAAKLIQPYFEKLIIPISCGIDLKTFNPKNEGDYLIKRYNMASSPILLYVGRLDKEKNLDMIIRALAKALVTIDIQLVIAGSGAEKNTLMKLSNQLGIGKKVIFPGFVPNADIPNLFALADCFIIAGTAELQSIVTMEAMATGLPILAVDAVALPELVKDGQNGFLFKPNDIDDLAKKMITIFSNENLRNTMAKKSLDLIAPHDIKKSIEKFEKIYSNEIRKRS
jgi:glycosyltransferase involved in cell wall biosynthesis